MDLSLLIAVQCESSWHFADEILKVKIKEADI